jgi:hypothetical protein
MPNEPTTSAVMREIHAKGGRMDTPIDLLLVGPDLIGAGHNEQQIVNALYWLVDAKAIELLSGNRVLVKKNPT